MVKVDTILKKDFEIYLKNNPTARITDFKNQFDLNSSQALKYYTETQEKLEGNFPTVHDRGIKPTPREIEMEEEEPEKEIYSEEENEPPIKEFLTGQVQQETEQDNNNDGYECGNCGFIFKKKTKYCASCGVQFYD